RRRASSVRTSIAYPLSVRYDATLSGASLRLRLHLLCIPAAEHALEVVVAEPPLGVEPVACRDEPVPEWIARAQRLRRLEVQLAPVRPPVVRVHDRLDLAEVRLV